MRNRQPRFIDHLVAVEQEIEVDRPRAKPWSGPLAAEPPLDRKESVEELLRRKIGLENGGGVQKLRLLAKPQRLRLTEIGDCDDVDLRVSIEEIYRLRKVGPSVTKVAPESYVCPH